MPTYTGQLGTLLKITIPSTPFSWRIQCHQDAAHQTTVASGQGLAKRGQGTIDWQSRYSFDQADKKSQSDLDATSETYRDAFFQAHFSCLGVTAKSGEVGIRSEGVVSWLGTKRKHEMTLPDGLKMKHDAAQDPHADLDNSGVGSVVVDPGEAES